MLSHNLSQLEYASSYAHRQFIRFGYTRTASPINFFVVNVISLGRTLPTSDSMLCFEYGEEGKTEWYVADREIKDDRRDIDFVLIIQGHGTMALDMQQFLTCPLSTTMASERSDITDFVCSRSSFERLRRHGQTRYGMSLPTCGRFCLIFQVHRETNCWCRSSSASKLRNGIQVRIDLLEVMAG